MAVGKELDEAFDLVKLEKIPDDLIEQLDELYEEADPDDQDSFAYLYEAASLRLSELTEQQIKSEK
jgi:hypothetical protein|tara:strand:- start:50 stop:247 length:198 start_codon:yes stop_codon:yes gene_type:complete